MGVEPFPTLEDCEKRGELMREELKKRTKTILVRTRNNMKKAGTYRREFEDSMERYADLRVQYDVLKEQWYEEGCAITEEYTNKSGATNQRKTPLYLAMETLRKELLELENIFGLTPKGLKQIHSKTMEDKKESALGKALVELDGEI